MQALKRTNLLQLARDGHVMAELERRWLALDDDGFFLLLGRLRRLLAQLERPALEGQVENDNDEAIRDLCARLDALAEALERIEEADHRSEDVVRATVVRPQQKVEQPRSSKPTRAASREQRASTDAAAVPTTVDDGWKIGVVERFDQRSLTGSIVFNGDRGSHEVPISSASFRKSRLINLFAGDSVEALIESRAEGRKEVVDLKRSVASRRIDAIRVNPHAVMAEPPVRARYFR